jgi:hypothetical protein
MKIKFNILVFLIISALGSELELFSQTTADTSKIDSTKLIPNYYKNADIKITYPWMPEEPHWCRNVSCQVVKENDKVTEIKIFKKDCVERITVKPELLSFEIYEAGTKKLIIKGP